MGLFDRLFGKDRRARAAQRAEVGGDLVRAAELWLEAGKPEEAARVLIARSDTELEPKVRLVLLGQAVSLTTPESEKHHLARKKRALLRLELAKSGALAAALRHDLREAAADLEKLGEPTAAAEAFRIIGDHDGRARALVAAGAVDELEEVLDDDVSYERSSREVRSEASRIETLIESGERRAALAACDALLQSHPNDPSIREKRDSLRSAKLVAPILRVTLGREGPVSYVLGDEVRLGRTEGEIQVSHSAVSRTHVRLYRDGAGVVHLADAGSRNGTSLRGVKIGGALPVVSETLVELGGEVPMRLVPELGRLRIDVGGRTYLAPLGPARLGPGDWELVVEDDGWIALRYETAAAFVGSIAMGKVTQLLAGDAFAERRDSPAVLAVER